MGKCSWLYMISKRYDPFTLGGFVFLIILMSISLFYNSYAYQRYFFPHKYLTIGRVEGFLIDEIHMPSRPFNGGLHIQYGKDKYISIWCDNLQNPLNPNRNYFSKKNIRDCSHLFDFKGMDDLVTVFYDINTKMFYGLEFDGKVIVGIQQMVEYYKSESLKDIVFESLVLFVFVIGFILYLLFPGKFKFP